jgi:hypothetical protein
MELWNGDRQIVWHHLGKKALSLQVGCSESSVVHRLREWGYCAKDKRGDKRRDLEVSLCFAPLVCWILSL